MRVGSIELKIQRNVQFTGKKARIGKVCFDEQGKMGVHTGYCPDCRGKILMSLDNAKAFANLYAEETKSKGFRQLTKMLEKRSA